MKILLKKLIFFGPFGPFCKQMAKILVILRFRAIILLEVKKI